MSGPEKENVRASKMVFIGKHNSPGEGCVVLVAALLRQVCFACTATLERQLHTPTQDPVLAVARPDAVWGAKDGRHLSLRRQIRSQERV
jgi:hypothetical protein